MKEHQEGVVSSDEERAGPKLVTPRDLGEEGAMKSWCENMDLGCTRESNVSEQAKSKTMRQAEDILGESHQDVPPPNLPPPHSSSMGDPPPPVSSIVPPGVDCRVSNGSSFVQWPTEQGTFPAEIVSHHVLVPRPSAEQLATKHWCTFPSARSELFCQPPSRRVHPTARAA